MKNYLLLGLAAGSLLMGISAQSKAEEFRVYIGPGYNYDRHYYYDNDRSYYRHYNHSRAYYWHRWHRGHRYHYHNDWDD